MSAWQPGSGEPPSLERRLILRLSLLYLATILVAVVSYALISLANHDLSASERFQALAHRVALAVTRDGDGVLRLHLSSEMLQRLAAVPDFQMELTELGSGRVVEGSSPWLAARLGPVASTLTRAEFTLESGDRRWHGLLVTEPAAAVALRVAMIYAHPTVADTLYWVAGELAEDVLPVMVPAMLLSLLVGIATVRSTVAPIRRLSAELGAVGPHRIDVSLAEDGVPLEVLPMVQAINHAIARLDAAMQQQRRMTANAAHELRTPLAILRARIEGMAAGPSREALERDVARMTRLVDQLMAVARLEAGQVVVEGAVDLVRVARETLAACAPLALAKGRGVELTAPDTAVTVRGNALALGDALMNLVDNALRFTAEGDCVEVLVEAPASGGVAAPAASGGFAVPAASGGYAVPAACGGVAVIEVRDRGPGIAPGERDQLFEPFWRGRDSRGSGSGLGLAIVAETVALHGGTVAAREREGGGTVFRVELPGGGRTC